MALFSRKKTDKKEEKEKVEKEVKQEAKQKEDKKLNLVNENILLIKKPRVTEKSQLVKKYRQYVFDVDKNANKTEVKKAIETIYNVKVEKVRIVNIPFKKRRLGVTQGKKSGYKKAIVTLKEGYQIEIIPQK